jgi:Rod binding domain-containing protein
MEISSNFLDINTIKPHNYDNIKKDNIKTDKALRDVCNNFESFFMNQILEISLKSSNMAGNGTGSKIVQSMYTDALSQKSAGSLGVSDLLYQFLREKSNGK